MRGSLDDTIYIVKEHAGWTTNHTTYDYAIGEIVAVFLRSSSLHRMPNLRLHADVYYAARFYDYATFNLISPLRRDTDGRYAGDLEFIPRSPAYDWIPRGTVYTLDDFRAVAGTGIVAR